MNLLKSILESLPADPISIRNIITGVHWTLVSSKYCGLGSTLVDRGIHGHSQVRDVGRLHQKSAQELTQWVLSENLLEASIGIAALNSLLEIDNRKVEQVNAADVIARESRGKNLAIVGHFPFVERLRPSVKNCWVIEKHPTGNDFPEEAAYEFIPQADVIAITGTAFINHTMDGLLSVCPPGSMVIVLGPSTPLSPLLFDAGISYLSGCQVIDEEAASTTILQGAIFPQITGVRLVTLSKGRTQGLV